MNVIDLEKFKNESLKCYIINSILKDSEFLSDKEKNIFMRNYNSKTFDKAIDSIINKINKKNILPTNNINQGLYIEEYMNFENNLFKILIDVNFCGEKINCIFCSVLHVSDLNKKIS